MSGDALSNLMINSRLSNLRSRLCSREPYNLRFFKNGLEFKKELKELERVQRLQRLQRLQILHEQ